MLLSSFEEVIDSGAIDFLVVYVFGAQIGKLSFEM
jgi:hypothetical protein